MSIITSIPLKPKVVTSKSNYVFSDMVLNDRVAGRSVATGFVMVASFLYIKRPAGGDLDVVTGKSLTTNEATPIAFLYTITGADGCNTISADDFDASSPEMVYAPFYIDRVGAEGLNDATFGYAGSELAAPSVTVVSDSSLGFDVDLIGPTPSIGISELVAVAIIHCTDVYDAWDAEYLGVIEKFDATSPDYVNPYSHTLFIDSRSTSLGTTEVLTDSESSRFEMLTDPQPAVYLSNCTGDDDGRQIVDQISSIDAKFQGDLYLDTDHPTYDGTSLRIVPNSNPSVCSYASFDNFYADQLEHDFTISFWVKLANVTSVPTALFCSKQEGKVDFVIGLNSQSLRLRIWASNTNESWNVFSAASTGRNIPLNTWTQITVVRSGSSLYPFVNGKLGTILEFTGALTGGSEPNTFGTLNQNCTAKFDQFFISRDARHLEDYTPSDWTLDSAVDAYYTFDGAEGATVLTNAASSSITATCFGNASINHKTPYKGTGCLKVVYGVTKLMLQDSRLDSLFVNDYTIELFFYLTRGSTEFAPLLINTDADGNADLILGFQADNTLRVWASSAGNTDFNIFNATSTGLTILANQWNYLRITGSNGKHQAFLNGTEGTALWSAQISGGKPTFNPYTSDTSLYLGELRIAKTVRSDDLRVFNREFQKLLERPIDYYDPKTTEYPKLTIESIGENIDQTISFS